MAGRTKTEAANHLRAWREKANLTQAQLAEMAGTKAGVISELESGRTQLGDKWLRRLAPLLGTRPGALLDHDPDSLPADILEIWATIPEEKQEDARRILRALGEPEPLKRAQ
jgi:transcriptional regulator with XRE-family HTH domain